jgi:biotin operon repressor
MWLVNNRNSENIVIATQHKIAEMTNCSRQTVVDTLRALMDVGAIKQVANGVYQLDPNTIFKGDGENRQQILLDYEGLPTAAKIPDEKKKKRASEKPKSPKRKTEANL